MAQLQYWNGTDFTILNNAEEIEYYNTESELYSTTIQTAIDELDWMNDMMQEQLPAFVENTIKSNSLLIKVSNLIELKEALSNTSNQVKRIVADTTFNINATEQFIVYGTNIFYSDLAFNIYSGANFNFVESNTPSTVRTLISFASISNYLSFWGINGPIECNFNINSVEFYITKIDVYSVVFNQGSTSGEFYYAIQEGDSLPSMAKQYDKYIQNISAKNALIGEGWNWDNFPGGTNTVTINEPLVNEHTLIFIEPIESVESDSQVGYWTAESFEGYFTITSTETEGQVSFRWGIINFPIRPM